VFQSALGGEAGRNLKRLELDYQIADELGYPGEVLIHLEAKISAVYQRALDSQVVYVAEEHPVRLMSQSFVLLPGWQCHPFSFDVRCRWQPAVS
jgi:hypothetical protein